MSRPLVIHGTLPGGAPFRLAMDPTCYVVMIEANDAEPLVCTRGKPRTIEQARSIGEVALALAGEIEATVTDLNHGLAPSSPAPAVPETPGTPQARIARALAEDSGVIWDQVEHEVWFEYADSCLRQTRKFTGRG